MVSEQKDKADCQSFSRPAYRVIVTTQFNKNKTPSFQRVLFRAAIDMLQVAIAKAPYMTTNIIDISRECLF